MRKINTLNEKEYAHQRDEMLRAMMNHYAKTLSHVSTSPLNDWVQARLDDIYMPPNVQLMEKDKGSFMKTGSKITEYRNVFLTDGKLSRHTFIQGEAGSGKSTFLAKLVMDWCSANKTKSIEELSSAEPNSANRDSRIKLTQFFKDLTTLKSYKFIFHVTLRDSVHELDILEMIKQQLIDTIYSKDDRENAYKLLNEIMKRERCLVLLDSLDEWIGTGNHCLPALAASLSLCDMLITTRLWKMTQSKIPDSKIDTLLQLEGVNEPFEVSKRLLACRGDYKELKYLDNKQSQFESYVFKNGLYELLISPMLLSLIVQSWAEGTELKGSRCEIYSLLLESLLKKANSEMSEFHRPPFRCFTFTQYIKPNVELVNRLAEAAFYFLFSDQRENALVFSITELKKSNSNLHEQERLDFALKSGILSATRKRSLLRSSSAFSFIHKSLQEFLSAYHIARNTHLNLIDEVISGYLHRHQNAYLDISQVFIFLCGLDIMAANKLSVIMDECKNCDIILRGYREAVANGHKSIALTVSHLECDYYNMRDAHSVWKMNTYNLLSLIIRRDFTDRDSPVSDIDSSPANVESPSHIEFNLSSCHMLKSLCLTGNAFWLKDSYSTARSEHPVWIVWIVLDSANPALCADPPPVLPSIKHISLRDVTCSSSWLRSLFSTLLTQDHEVYCELMHCEISSFVDCALTKWISADIRTDVNNTFSLHVYREAVGTGLWEALHGQYIKCLNLVGLNAELIGQNAESLFESVHSLSQLETLNMNVNTKAAISSNMWEALNSFNIKRVTLSLDSVWCGLINNVSILSQTLLSNNMETICIYLNAQPCMMEAMHGLPIKRLSLYGSGERLEINNVSSLYKLLSSLKQLEKLSVIVNNDSPGLWEALHGLNIKSLSLHDGIGCLSHVTSLYYNVPSLSQLLSSLSQLETLHIKVCSYSRSGLWDALRGLNIKSLSLSGLSGGLDDWDKDSAVKQMETLSLVFPSLTLLETLSIGVDDDICGLSEALRGLYIKRLCLSGGACVGLNVHHAELLSQSLSSLTQLETLTLHAFTYIDLQLPLSLKYLNFYCTGISPPELRDLLKTLSACTQTVESKLGFGCALCTYEDDDGILQRRSDQITLEEYIPIQQELNVLRNVAVKRLRILDKIRADRWRWYEYADSAWSVRDIVVEEDDNDDGIVDDETYHLFVRHLYSDIVNRISMRLQSNAASNL